MSSKKRTIKEQSKKEQYIQKIKNEDEIDERKPKKKQNQQKIKQSKNKRKKNKWVEDEAEEDSNDNISFENDDDAEIKILKDNEFYTDQQLWIRKHDFQKKINEIEEKAKLQQNEEDLDDNFEKEDDEDSFENKPILPSANDPRLWQVRVKKNTEKISTMSLMMKSIDLAKRGQPLAILSATYTENVEGYIYIEAYKEIHVKEAIKGLTNIFSGKIILVPTEEMNVIYRKNQNKVNQIQQYQWIRIKQGGTYNGDLGLVEKIVENKIYVRLIPRLENPQKDQINQVDKKLKPKYGEKQKFNKFARIPQKLFNPEIYKNNESQTFPDLDNKKFYKYKNQHFRKGFLFKPFQMKYLQLENIRPSIEEVSKFNNAMETNQADLSDDEDQKAYEAIKKTFYDGNSIEITKGDKIKVIKGDLIGLNGTVVSIEEGYILFQTQYEQQNKTFREDLTYVTKYFEPGDPIRVIDGKHKGETGLVTGSDDIFTFVALEQTKKEIKILSSHLKLKTEIDQNNISSFYDKKKGTQLNANDLVQFNKNVGVILQVQEDYVKVINDQGKIQSVKITDITKIFEKNTKALCQDSLGHNICIDNVVKCIDGRYKGKKGVVKHIYKDYVFLWDKELSQTNGIFVEKKGNIEILGQEFMKGIQGKAIASMNRRIRDPIIGKTVMIIGGNWKGYRGLVTQADDKQVTVEISSSCKKVPIERSYIDENIQKVQQRGQESVYAGQTIYDAGKTPNYLNTPSYYPNSPHWGAHSSPKYGAIDYEYDHITNNFSRPGSEYNGNNNVTNKGQSKNPSWIKNEN